VDAILKPSSGRGQTFDSLSKSLQEAILRIPPHEQNTPPSIKSFKPAADFIDEAVFEKEQSKIFRRYPVVLAPSARLPDQGSAIAHDGYGVPIVLTRGRDGKVRAFLNACTHKGAQLTKECASYSFWSGCGRIRPKRVAMPLRFAMN
jgi:hypothetical protein